MTMTLMDIIKQKHHPEQWKSEQDTLHKERLEFIEGFKALLKSKEQEATHLSASPKRPLFKDQTKQAQQQIVDGGLRQFFD